jgi:peroxiredoxin
MSVIQKITQKKLHRWLLFFVLPLLLFAAGIYTWHASSNSDSGTSLPPSAHTIQGNTIPLQSAEQIPTLIQFWATSCTTCLKEMPDMIALYNDYKDTGFELIAIAMQYDSANSLREYTQHYQLPFHVVHDQTGELMQTIPNWLKANKIYGTPTTFLVAPNGSLMRQYVGFVPFDEVRKILDDWRHKKP